MIYNAPDLRCLSAFGFLLVWFVAAGCVNSKQSASYDFRGPSSGQLIKWQQQNELTLASAEEQAAGEKCRALFQKQVAISSDGRLRVSFLAGTMVGDNTIDGGLSTTSSYLLRDANGRELARAPSRCTEAITQSDQNDLRRGVWYAPQGDTVVVYEYFSSNPGPLLIVFRLGPESEGGWQVRFFDLPFCRMATIDEGAHSVCHGLIGDMILVDPAIGDGRLYKKSISKLEVIYPFPFTQG